MGVLDDVVKMRDKGMSETEITSELKQKNVSPKAINDALSQAQIKNAVSNEGMQPSIMQDTNAPPKPSSETYTPHTQEIKQETPQPQYEETAYAPQQEEYLPAEQDYYQGGYDQQYDNQYYPDAEGGSSDTMVDIAEQVFEDKIKKIRNQTSDFNEAKALMQTKIESLDNRLQKIESMIDKLQITILEKVGSYGQNLDSIKKEMSMMQDSFKKVVNKAVSSSPAKKVSKTTKKI